MLQNIPIFRNLFLCFLLLFSLESCRENARETVGNSAEKVSSKNVKITDDLGRKLEVPAQPKRILALSAGMTEMLFAVVPEANIVGRTQACNYPKEALKKTVVSSFPLDLEGLLQLKPDLIFTEAGMTSLEAAEQIQRLGIPVYYQE